MATAPAYPPSLDELLNCSFILLDKPCGPSSHEVTSHVKRMFGISKTGHAGTLDPQVSGVQIIGLNKATRLLLHLAAKEKKYVGVLRLRNAPKNIAELQNEMNRLTGKIIQMPPKESAVAKKARRRKVYEYRAIELKQNTALFSATVEAGTYVRVLCSEVGKRFGGGKMLQLRRISVGNVGEQDLVRLPDLADALWMAREKGDERRLRQMLHPAPDMIQLPRLTVVGSAVEAVCRGAPLALSGVAAAEAGIRAEGEVWLQTPEGRLIALAVACVGSGEIENEKAKKNPNPRLAIAKPRVIIFEPKGVEKSEGISQAGIA